MRFFQLLILSAGFCSLAVPRLAAQANQPGAIDTTFALELGPVNRLAPVATLAVQRDGKIVAGTSSGVFRWHPNGAFDTRLAFDDQAWSFALQSDQRMLVAGGRVTFLSPVPSVIARILPDGSRDATFAPTRHYGIVRTMAVDAQGRILAGGFDLTWNLDNPAQSRTNFFRLNPNGELDATFNPLLSDIEISPRRDKGIQKIVSLRDGRMLVLGTMTSAGSTPTDGLAVLNSDGSLNTSFSPGLGGNLGLDAEELPDGKILIIGRFASFRGQPVPPVIRLRRDFSLDAAFNAVVRPNIAFYDSAAQPDGKVLIIGQGSREPLLDSILTRLNADGSVDASFPQITIPFRGSTPPIMALAGDTLVIGSDRTNTVNGVPITNFFRIHLGNVTPAPGAPPVFSLEPRDAVLALGRPLRLSVLATSEELPSYQWQRNGMDIPGATNTELAFAGVFPGHESQYRALARNAFGFTTSRVASVSVMFQPAGSLRPEFSQNLSLTSFVHALGMQPDGKLLAMLRQAETSGGIRSDIARFDTEGGRDLSFAPFPALASGADTNTFISAMQVQEDGKILVGGGLATSLSKTNSIGLQRLLPDGSPDPSFSAAGLITYHVQSIGLRPDGSALAGLNIDFPLMGGAKRAVIPWVDTNGAALPSQLNMSSEGHHVSTTHPQQRINAAISLPDGAVYIGGFIRGESMNRRGLARVLSSGVDTTYNPLIRFHDSGWMFNNEPGASLAPEVTALALLPDGKMMVAGVFTHAGQTERNQIARLNPDGTVDESFAPGEAFGYVQAGGIVDQIHALAIQPDGRILVGGALRDFERRPIPNLIRLNADGSLDPTFDVGAGPNGPVRAIQILPDGDILVGGDFTTFSGIPQNGIAKITGQPDQEAKLFTELIDIETTRIYSKGQAGKTYTLQFKNTLADAEWQNSEALAGTGSTMIFTNSILGNSERYYRLKID